MNDFRVLVQNYWTLACRTYNMQNCVKRSLVTHNITLTFLSSLLLHVVQTGLHVLQVALGYMLMLLVMSYNVWIFLGVILGSTLGYFISFPLLSKKQLRWVIFFFFFSIHLFFTGKTTGSAVGMTMTTVVMSMTDCQRLVTGFCWRLCLWPWSVDVF